MIRKIALLFAAILAFPLPTRTALVQSELTYNVRNARGMYPFGAYFAGTGQVNVANGNLVFSRRLLSRPGRAGSARISDSFTTARSGTARAATW